MELCDHKTSICYLEALKDERAHDYPNWRDVIFGINNVCAEGKYDGALELMHRFSKKDADKYDATVKGIVK
jgi:hypothetical protein